MSGFEHQRHKPGALLVRPRQLIVACAPMRSNVNLSAIARTASASAIERLILTGNATLHAKIARDGISELQIAIHRSLKPVLKRFAEDGYHLVGLEQATNSQSIYDYHYHRRTLLVIGNERKGISADILELLDEVIEIPVFGLPHSYNAATAASMAIYEYCKQFPQG